MGKRKSKMLKKNTTLYYKTNLKQIKKEKLMTE